MELSQILGGVRALLNWLKAGSNTDYLWMSIVKFDQLVHEKHALYLIHCKEKVPYLVFILFMNNHRSVVDYFCYLFLGKTHIIYWCYYLNHFCQYQWLKASLDLAE